MKLTLVWRQSVSRLMTAVHLPPTIPNAKKCSSFSSVVSEMIGQVVCERRTGLFLCVSVCKQWHSGKNVAAAGACCFYLLVWIGFFIFCTDMIDCWSIHIDFKLHLHLSHVSFDVVLSCSVPHSSTLSYSISDNLQFISSLCNLSHTFVLSLLSLPTLSRSRSVSDSN